MIRDFYVFCGVALLSTVIPLRVWPMGYTRRSTMECGDVISLIEDFNARKRTKC